MPATLYYHALSPPSRAVLLALKTLSIPFKLKEINLSKGEHRTLEYLKLNPRHTIPTFVDDDGWIVIDSHVINAYLVGKYAKDDKLYPKDLKLRSVVDHCLYFDTGVLFPPIQYVMRHYFHTKMVTGITPEIVSLFEDSYGKLENLLGTAGLWIAGNHITIADFSILTTIANSAMLLPVRSEEFPLVAAYVKRGEANIPFCAELNAVGAEAYKTVLGKFNFKLPDP